jgi:hypothetical protein
MDNPFAPDYREPESDDTPSTITLGNGNTVAGTPADHITYHPDLIQGSDEWLAAALRPAHRQRDEADHHADAEGRQQRQGAGAPLGTAVPAHDRLRRAAIRRDDMLRGQEDEIEARAALRQHYAPVTETGFVTNDRWGFTIGYSPDGLVGDDGLIECKSRASKYQIQTIAENEVPAPDYMIQLQTGLLVTERKWIDFVSYSGGLPMFVKRVEPDP